LHLAEKKLSESANLPPGIPFDTVLFGAIFIL